MAIILSIETSTTNCSVSIAKDGELCALKEENNPNYSHSENLHKFIKEALKDASFSLNDLNAIAVSKGPGSYTGLRIGVSTAKGLCFSLDIPLISIPTLESLAHQQQVEKGSIVSMLDARRMEVYTASFDKDHNRLTETEARIIDEDSFSDLLARSEVHFIGTGTEKCKEVIQHPNARFTKTEQVPSAKEMNKLAYHKYKISDFEDVAYFEPYYLKDFIVGKKKA
ncbi:tRNA (adenosine(37)-N6)-threonylcarbamoyltransferase complex dimerization subunit type 1 TsaB [Leptobacterium flavescens]|uniref:tRNA (Adenosine(37)-N6)-threonylcarbamoyltransferase complex dimerization subunit type 1 TsaB n=1 Tax=Leptobacterium flavescens TaxID=472055 RepID=A0A6P0UHA3_9FLAO|nr:tRNA (adenosine(37)-N6)-threonylcarbamoyltransferase complex dimerization subunit type 1 TsaB [Leptobacterium flavescens]NER12645.1 tRNA (adenosine(37)-N6)-threonylcarbamoyltransferase complex dimerization subunit type 1 TsaB [Leptobacterium flavescens]